MFGVGDNTQLVRGPPSLAYQTILVANGDTEFVGNLSATEYDAFMELENIDHLGIAYTALSPNDAIPRATRPQAEASNLVAKVGLAALNSMICDAVEGAEQVPEFVVATDGNEDVLAGWLSWLDA